MKIRRMLLCAIALSMVGGASIGANEALQTWKGKKVRVTVNGDDISGGALQIDGKTYIPLRSDTLQALVKNDPNSDAIHIYKPNVHLFLFYGDKNAMKPFGYAKKGQSGEFFVFAQVDNLQTKVRSIKTVVADPNGETVESQVYKLEDGASDSFWHVTSPIKMEFKLSGQYKVKFYIKQSEDSDFELVSEKAILSKAE
ncbi:copper amine oxidase [Paenibacillus thermotolerans]|uniref:copper amine oxidase n=1 Tax=Paenibacillus thermotolerans TaxID=3027807 RepID=UPI0023686002|nr:MULTISPECIES: copper amine oxidase [unclassified Paenibacillus]